MFALALSLDPINLKLIVAALALGVLAILIPTLLRFAYWILLAAFGFILIVLALKVLAVVIP